VHVYNSKGPAVQTLTEADSHLTTCPVEALGLKVGGGTPTAIAVVLLNWGGTPLADLRVKVLGGIARPARVELASGAPLGIVGSIGGTNEVSMRLEDVDV
jgi:hypothetical protein